MKRLLSLLLAALLTLAPLGALGEAEPTSVQELTAQGVTVWRYSLATETDALKQTVDYPVFRSENAPLEQYLDEAITKPLLMLRKLEPMAQPEAYQGGAKDAVRGGFLASLDFEGLLSLEATIGNRPAGQESYSTEFFYRIIDLSAMRELTLYELFAEDPLQVDEAVAQAVYARAQTDGVLLSTVASAQQVPSPNSYYLTSAFLRCIYDEGIISETYCDVDIPWEELNLTRVGLLAGNAAQATQPAAPTDTPAPTATPVAEATAPPPEAIVTPTPMPLAIGDAAIQEALCQGLWRPLQGDESTYYQFTADGKLLVVTVMDYSLQEGTLASEALSGTVTAGGTAWTLSSADGVQSGFVLNRAARAVNPAELVTPSPTPQPTDTPAPTDTPEPTNTPTPSPAPDPLEAARASVPALAPLQGAAFAREKVLKVYSGPGTSYYRSSGAQVATNEHVTIYGLDGEWVLVSYEIGNGKRSRIGYVEDSTLAEPDAVQRLTLGAAKATLARKTEATDDPLNAKGAICELNAGDEVTLLAFLGEEWVYIETTYKNKPCRLFVPTEAFKAE